MWAVMALWASNRGHGGRLRPVIGKQWGSRGGAGQLGSRTFHSYPALAAFARGALPPRHRRPQPRVTQQRAMIGMLHSEGWVGVGLGHRVGGPACLLGGGLRQLHPTQAAARPHPAAVRAAPQNAAQPPASQCMHIRDASKGLAPARSR